MLGVVGGRRRFPFEAGGARSGVPEDASAGLPTYLDAAGRAWAYHPSGDWMPVHQIRSGDTLWNLSGAYYGTSSLAGVRQIHGVPENTAIQGTDPNRGLIPGDRILIPGLPPPAGAPSPGGSLADAPPIDAPISPPTPPGATLPGQEGPGPVNDPVAANELPTDVHPGGDIVPVSMPGQPVLNAPTKPAEDISTGAKVALGLVGALGLGLTVWLLMRKPKKRRNPSRRLARVA